MGTFLCIFPSLVLFQLTEQKPITNTILDIYILFKGLVIHFTNTINDIFCMTFTLLCDYIRSKIMQELNLLEFIPMTNLLNELKIISVSILWILIFWSVNCAHRRTYIANKLTGRPSLTSALWFRTRKNYKSYFRYPN